MATPRILFIPVSSVFGIGEYTRSLIIANAIKQHWPDADIHFILNEKVSYFSSCPYPVHGCKDSATKDTLTVNAVIKKLKPDLVVFDASGRAQQFKQAKKLGAKVAFISQHKKKRSRGLKLNRLFNTDIHWVVQPDFCIAPLSQFQKVKLALFNKPAPKNIGAVYSPVTENTQTELLAKLQLKPNEFFVFNAGSGGHKIADGKVDVLSADIYFKAAKQFYRQSNVPCIMVFGENYPKKIPKTSINENGEQFICVRSLNNEEFIALLTSAKGRVISAGDTILQCIALNKACVAAPVSSDQPKRLAACAKAGLLLEAQLSSESLCQQATQLLEGEVTQGLLGNMKKTSSLSALEIVLRDIKHLLEAADK